MLFNSLHFAVFLPLALLAYGFASKSYRWLVLLIASYYFYMCWKPEYALLIGLSTVVDYCAALKVGSSERVGWRRFYLAISLCTNLGLLFLFKYYGFATESLEWVTGYLSTPWDFPQLDILLPVGISFYTFQTLSYTIDVYRGEVAPETHFGKFAVYVSFFPQLVAGPIERSSRLLPQIRDLQPIDPGNLIAGLDRILWGLFKKLVVADRVAIWVDSVFGHHAHHNGTTLFVAAVFFAFQIYCDFSGYSDIAIGSARMMGIDLMENFRRPYFASSIREFWQRWHISLSSWFRDYLYIPLGGSRATAWRWAANVLTVFFVSGIWHGANSTFFVWGLIHGLALIAAHPFMAKERSEPSGPTVGTTPSVGNLAVVAVRKLLSVGMTFFLVCIAWIFFRADSVSDAFEIVAKVFTSWGPLAIKGGGSGVWQFVYGAIAIGMLLVVEFRRELMELGWTNLGPKPPSWLYHAVIIALILNFGVFDGSQFIYFQF